MKSRKLQANCRSLQIICIRKGQAILLEFVAVAAKLGNSILPFTPIFSKNQCKTFLKQIVSCTRIYSKSKVWVFGFFVFFFLSVCF